VSVQRCTLPLHYLFLLAEYQNFILSCVLSIIAYRVNFTVGNVERGSYTGDFDSRMNEGSGNQTSILRELYDGNLEEGFLYEGL